MYIYSSIISNTRIFGVGSLFVVHAVGFLYILSSEVSSLIVLLAVEDSENGEEEVDDIEVETDGRGDFLLDVVVSHDKLCVHQDVSPGN